MIDVNLPLYDANGYEHSLVTASMHQVVTKYAGCFGLWNRKTGECLNEGMGDLRLSNEMPCSAEIEKMRAHGALLLAQLHAQAAIDKASASDSSPPREMKRIK